MGLKIYWTDIAKNEVKSIYIYLKKEANLIVAKNITKEITHTAKILINQPHLGQIEPLLFDRDKEFRYLIYNNYKIIYLINLELNKIEIVDIFHTNQEPLKIKRTK